MKFSTWLILLLIPILFGSFSIRHIADDEYTITVNVTNIRSSNGRIQLQLYRTEESFTAENPYKELYVSKKGMSNKSLSYTIYGLKSGTYGIALLDDENANKEMDYGWVMPEEGFGFSDYYHTAWSKPKFKQFSFNLSANKSVQMKIRYV